MYSEFEIQKTKRLKTTELKKRNKKQSSYTFIKD